MNEKETSVCPLEYRYGSPEMRSIFTREATLKRLVEVEAALLRGLEAAGFAPEGCWRRLQECASGIKVEELDSLEARVGHDIAALAFLLGEKCGECGGYVHLGATSYDIVDNAWALALKEALAILKKRLRSVLALLAELTERHADLVMAGRTHGRHALPITLGFKLANYVYELSRSYERLCESAKRVVRGKISGAVGTMAAWFQHGLLVEGWTLKALDLEPHSITTQVAPRDGFAEIVCNLAILGSQLDRLSLEIRELMRDEIEELLTVEQRTGSSTMPHKKNPVLAERVSGLARILRGLCLTALENVVLLHERDLTNSSVERIMLPHAFLVSDQMLADTLRALECLYVNEKAIKRNLNASRGLMASECILVKLVLKAGMPRHEAHELLSSLATRVSNGSGFEDVLRESRVVELLDWGEIQECFDYSRYLGNYRQLIERALGYYRKVIESC